MHPEKYISLTFQQRQTLDLALLIRNQMEQFHGIPNTCLPQGRMPEFNSAIRYALYDFFVEDSDLDDPFDSEWIERLTAVILDSIYEFFEQYIPDDQKYAFLMSIEQGIVEYLDEIIDGISDDALYRFVCTIPEYWEIPGLDPRPTF